MAVRAFIVLNVRGNMKKILALILLSFAVFSCSDFFSGKVDNEMQSSEDFVQGSEDIPLILGMEKIADDSIGFDSSSGSIISSSYTTKIDLKKVRNFYIKTLPDMGWKLVQNGETRVIFKREKENLEIEFSKQNEKKVVRFFISSAV